MNNKSASAFLAILSYLGLVWLRRRHFWHFLGTKGTV